MQDTSDSNRYGLEIASELEKAFKKLAKRDKITLQAIDNKVKEILKNPYAYKPLHAPLQNKRRVHISGSYVLIFSIDEEKKAVKLIEFEHHDVAYK